MSERIIFYIVFVSQIMLLSYYFPNKIHQRVKKVLDLYPASKFPKLYNKTEDYYQLGAKIYFILNKIILIVGIILISTIAYWDHSHDIEIEGVYSLFYFILQMFPIFIMEVAGFSYFKQMRKENIQTTRKATIKARNLFDFVSPGFLALALITNIGCIFFTLFLDQFQFYIGSDAFVVLITLVLSNTLFALIIRFNINGKKLDPYQASEDRLRQITLTIKSIVSISIMASLFIIIQQAIESSNMDYLNASLISFYLQLIAWFSLGNILKNFRIEDINFDVYKADKSTV